MKNHDAPMLMYPKFLQARERGLSESRFNAIRAGFGNSTSQRGGGCFTVGRLAVMPVMGPMMKGWGYPDQSELKSLVKGLRDDAEIDGVFSIWDTPGGSVAGTSDFAEELDMLGSTKPHVAYCEDMCASAGYWSASSATRIYANSTAMVGSIGVISWLTDATEFYSKMGIKEIPIATGKFKTAGDEAMPATEETIDYLQSKIDLIYDQFVSAVSKGRNISGAKIRAMEAAVFVGKEAVDAGLVDEISTMDVAFSKLQRMTKSKNVGGAKSMLRLLEIEGNE